MRLKSVELHGFKSFCDRSIIRFEHPIVGIVGPNGCGKSNVLDAIRWVMGEQSMKSLRGKQRSDVIFNGSEQRKASPFSEVTLTLSGVPVEIRPEGFENKSEIAITRRLTSDNKNLYFLNRHPCRLRDIRMLFMGTGLGRHSYALIEQGRVNEFIQATPLKRRLLFEEAAGISRYKEHRKTAESRMNQTQTNLDRLSDVMKELNNQRNSLQRQARKARRHRVLKDDIRELDLYLSSHRYLEGWAKQRHIALMLTNMEQEENGLRAAIRQQEKNQFSLQQKLRIENHRLQELRDTMQEAQAHIALLEQRAVHLSEDLDGLDKRRGQLKTEIERIEWQYGKDKETLAQLKEQRNQMAQEEDDSQQDLTRLTASLEALNQSLNDSDETIDEIKSDVIDTATQEAAHRNQLQELERRVLELQSRQVQNEQELREAREQEVLLKQQLRDTSQLLERCYHEREHLLDQEEQLVEEQALLRLKLKEQETKVRQYEQKLTEMQARLSSLEELQSQYEGLNEASRTLLEALQEGGDLAHLDCEGIVAEWIDPPSEYEVAVAAALGDRLHALVFPQQDSILQALDYLREHKLGRAGFFLKPTQVVQPLAQLPEHPVLLGALAPHIPSTKEDRRLVDHILAPYVLAESLPLALNLLPELPSGIVLVTADGTLLHSNGEVIGGEARSTGLGFLQRRRQIKELQDKTEELFDMLEDQYKTLRQQQHQQEENNEREKQLRDQIQQLTLKHTALEKDQQRLEADHKRQSERIHLLDNERKRLHTLAENLGKDQDALTQRVAQLAMLREEQEQRLSAARERIDNDRSQQNELTQELTSLKVAIAARQERQEALEQQWDQIEKRQKSLTRRKLELENEQDSLDIDLGQKQESRLLAQAEAKELKQKHIEQNETLASFVKEHETSEAKLAALTTELDDNRKRVETLSEERTEQRLQQREVEVQLKALDHDIRERYGLPIGEALPGNHCKPLPEPSDFHRLMDMRKQLERIGEVNSLAEQEYNEVDERYQFLKGQVDDLEKTLASLKRSIQKINQQSRETFRETFDSIRGHFRELFPKLFEGGQADLVLTEPNNLLETGVDITVRPPGKRRQNIVLLSGGEKAMTTVALIFSFFLYKPSPFCVLDELDAPLDDANNDRFNRLLRELCSLSQFIVITHNKRTMEMTNQLYGVTMQDPGVSTVVTVQLGDEITSASVAA